MKKAIFKNDLNFANDGQKLLAECFYPKFARDEKFVPLVRSRGSIYIQRNCHIDCVMASKKGGSITVEEKIVRWPGRKYTAMTIETHSNLERTQDQKIGDGWIKTSTADYLLYAFQQENNDLLVWFFDMPELQRWFESNFLEYHISDTPNEFYTTRCRIVPVGDIPKSIICLSEYHCTSATPRKDTA